jgi:hypothetical protein
MDRKRKEDRMVRGETDSSEMLQWVVAAAAFVLSGALAWDGFATAIETVLAQMWR